jgi:drug/metabolite transporter (DMT)-like permease
MQHAHISLAVTASARTDSRTGLESMATGILFAAVACCLWALAFVAPIVLEGVAPTLVALGRYGAYGLISLALVPLFWRKTFALSRPDWCKAVALSTIGNLVYYILLTGAIQMIDIPGPTAIIGLLPLTIPILANWRHRELPWPALFSPLVVIALGLILVNVDEYQRLASVGQGLLVYAAGLGLAIAALACWTWYGVANALWLQSRPHIDPGAWTIAQGVTLLPLVVVGFATGANSNFFGSTMLQVTETDTLTRFLLVSVVVGLASSWLATLCWSRASRLLPTTLTGQLIVFETVAAIAYGHIYQGRGPSVAILLGVVLLCAGVALGVRAVQGCRAVSPT